MKSVTTCSVCKRSYVSGGDVCPVCVQWAKHGAELAAAYIAQACPQSPAITEERAKRATGRPRKAVRLDA